jgi:predicted metal-dependent phosphoesterase TrpH
VIVRGLFHLHTVSSRDATLTYEAYADFARENGLSFLVFSEHRDKMFTDDVQESVEACEALSTPDLLLVPGQEQETVEPRFYHIIGAGVRRPLGAQDPLESIAEIRRLGGISILAHPARYRRHPPGPEIYRAIDGIEGWNLRYDGRAGVREDVREILTDNPGVSALAGIDAHDPEDLRHPGIPVLAVDVEDLTEAKLLAALVMGRFTVESGGERMDLRRRPSGAKRLADALHRGIFGAARGIKRGLDRVGLPLPGEWVRRARRKF